VIKYAITEVSFAKAMHLVKWCLF